MRQVTTAQMTRVWNGRATPIYGRRNGDAKAAITKAAILLDFN
jgi:hypothetical protein